MQIESSRRTQSGLILVAAATVLSVTSVVAAQENKEHSLLITAMPPDNRNPSGVGAQIVRVNADGSGRKVLTSKDDFSADPALSPDGKRIAFVVIDDDRMTGLYVMNADGSGRKRLVPKGDTDIFAPSWSPDSKRIAFCTIVWSKKNSSLKPRLYIVNADGENLKRLDKADGMMPIWSPDGKRLLFTREENGGNDATSLCVVDADGTNVHQLVKNGAIMGAWSPDGKSLAYVVLQRSNVRGEVAGLFVAQADGSESKKVFGGPREITFGVQWSLDGKRLFFTRRGHERVVEEEGKKPQSIGGFPSAVYVIEIDRRNLRRVTTGKEPEYLGGTALFAAYLWDGKSSPPGTEPAEEERPDPATLKGDDKAARWIEDIGGGKVTRDKKQNGQPIVEVDLAHTLVKDADLKELAGLKVVQHLSLAGTAVTDAGLKHLATLKSLKSLILSGTRVEGVGLKDLSGLQHLQYLNLDSTAMTDAGLKELAGIRSLQNLVLHRTAVTDGGMKELAALQNLEVLELLDTRVSDAGLKHLGACKNLVMLNLQATKVTAAGLKELAPLKKLDCLFLFPHQITDATLRTMREIDKLHVLSKAYGKGHDRPKSRDEVTGVSLSFTRVTDAGLKELSVLKNLTRLDLDETGVTDAGLRELVIHKNLTLLDLRQNRTVTDAGVAELRKALPKCLILR